MCQHNVSLTSKHEFKKIPMMKKKSNWDILFEYECFVQQRIIVSPKLTKQEKLHWPKKSTKKHNGSTGSNRNESIPPKFVGSANMTVGDAGARLSKSRVKAWL